MKMYICVYTMLIYLPLKNSKKKSEMSYHSKRKRNFRVTTRNAHI